jgi:hypothetical protein
MGVMNMTIIKKIKETYFGYCGLAYIVMFIARPAMGMSGEKQRILHQRNAHD